MYSKVTLIIYYKELRVIVIYIYIYIIHTYICEQIYQKGSYTRTTSGLTFRDHSTDTTIDQQFMLVPLPNLQWSAFTEASFTGLSGVHGCSGGLLINGRLSLPGQADRRRGITTGLAGETGHQGSYILRRVELKTA